MIKKQTIIATLAAMLLISGSLKAQDTVANARDYSGEVAVSVYGPAVAGMPFSGDIDWQSKMGYALGFGADYTCWFSQNVGLATGLKFSYLNSHQKSGAFVEYNNGTLPITGMGDQNVVVKTSATQATETRTMTYLEIPVRLALEASGFYCNLGASLSIALTNNADYGYTTDDYSVTEVPSMGITMPAPVPVALNDAKQGSLFQKSDAAWPLYVLVGGELGYRFRLDDRNAVSLGLYGRYGVLKSYPNGDSQSFTLQNNQMGINQPSATTHVNNMGYYEVGLRIAYHYGVCKK